MLSIFFMCSLVIHIYSLVSCLCKSFAHILTGLQEYKVTRILYVFWIQVLYQIYMICKYFLSVCILSFYLMECFKKQKLLMMTSNLSLFAFIACAFDVISDKSLLNSVVLNWRQFCPQRTFGNAWRHIFLSQLGRGSLVGRGQGCYKHPTVHRTAPQQRITWP